MVKIHAAFLCIALSAVAVHAQATADIKGFAPVSISSANYRTTPREQLLRAVENPRPVLNPSAPDLRPLAEPQHFIFMPGEIFESDLTYEQVTALLTPVLAAKGYVNGADALGIIRQPTKISLILRVNFGTRLWRLPTVRAEDLTWKDGMVARPKGRGLHVLGSDRLWDHRAGGKDDALSAAASNSANAQSFGFSAGPQGAAVGAEGAASAPASAAGSGVAEYGSTREFHLIVVDAFEYQEVKAKGTAAKRIWTTFVAAPREPGQNFSQVAGTLVRNAAAYFGETSAGLQVYTDVRAEVKIGDLIEVKDEQTK